MPTVTQEEVAEFYAQHILPSPVQRKLSVHAIADPCRVKCEGEAGQATLQQEMEAKPGHVPRGCVVIEQEGILAFKQSCPLSAGVIPEPCDVVA
jgi:hypothetical protein